MTLQEFDQTTGKERLVMDVLHKVATGKTDLNRLYQLRADADAYVSMTGTARADKKVLLRIEILDDAIARIEASRRRIMAVHERDSEYTC